MSHLRKGAGGDSGTNGRSAGLKKSDNAVATSSSPNTKPDRSRSKNKIPKAVRYDLENALLSLCDVWFDEIKPHLVANGIKLHMHGAEASGDHAAPGTCPHLHPGAASDNLRRQNVSFASCCPTRRPASIELCRKPTVPTALQSHEHLNPLATLQKTQNHHHNYEKKSKRFRAHRKRQTLATQQLQWRVPRLCRTYSLLPIVPTQSPMLSKRTSSPQQRSPSCLHNQIPMKFKRNNTTNKGNQTKPINSRSNENRNSTKTIPPQLMRFAAKPVRPTSPDALTSLVQRNTTNSRMARESKVLFPTERKLLRDLSNTTVVLQRTRPGTYKVVSTLKPKTLHEEKEIDKLYEKKRRQVLNAKPIGGTPRRDSAVIESTADSKCDKPPSNVEEQKPIGRKLVTTILSSNSNKHRQNLPTETDLFREDLIDIIHDKRDKRLNILYNGADRNDMPSIMNLLPSPGRHKPTATTKPPWK